ncbi:hydroxyisourate hydrolase [Nonomuraea sediminis]|uniref:hydroxyisourate hydrolase n=1 Tax=Nonomuraea sediminis TaxID=2835864 RepID=UPI001BDD9124|nr:hydroxyisourate hydrolase [Nonomuraea sediminis]
MPLRVDVVDVAHGRPAAGVRILAFRLAEASSSEAEGCTDQSGSLVWPDLALPLSRGSYRLELNVDSYFATLGIVPANPLVVIVFRVSDPADPPRLTVLIAPNAHTVYSVN